jgi:hypothetical protein
MSWLGLIAAALALLRSLIEYLRDRRTIDAATAELLLNSNREMLDAIDKANAAREQIRAHIARNPSDVMSDDEFRRND